MKYFEVPSELPHQNDGKLRRIDSVGLCFRQILACIIVSNWKLQSAKVFYWCVMCRMHLSQQLNGTTIIASTKQSDETGLDQRHTPSYP